MWRCPKCGERIDEALSQCWQCGHTRGGADDSLPTPKTQESFGCIPGSEATEHAADGRVALSTASAGVEVYAAADISEAYFLKNLLEAAGIQTSILGAPLQMAVGALPLGHATAPRLWVSRADQPRARKLVERWEAGHDEDHAFIEEPAWRCDDCGEEVDGNLELCWSCGTSREGERNPKFQREEDAASSPTSDPLSSDAQLVLAILRIAVLVFIVVPLASLLSPRDASVDSPVPRDHLPIEYFPWSEYAEEIAGRRSLRFPAPSEAKRYLVRGADWLTMGEYDKAIKAFSEAIRLDPGDAHLYYARGVAWRAKNDNSRAIDDFNTAIGLDPEDAVHYGSRGTTWLAKGEYHKAIEDLNEAIRLDPTADSYYYYVRGRALERLGRLEEALLDYTWTLELDPTHASAYLHRGLIRYGKGEYENAMADLEAAITEYGRIIRGDPSDAASYLERGLAWKCKGEYRKAVTDYEEAIRLAPESPRAYSARAWILSTCPESDLRNGREAVKSARQACQLVDQPHWFHLESLAAAHAEIGNFQEAIKWQTKVIDLAPQHEQEECQGRLELYKAEKPYREQSNR